MKKYDVYILTPYTVYESVKAESEYDAIKKIELPEELDIGEVYKIVAYEVDTDDEVD